MTHHRFNVFIITPQRFLRDFKEGINMKCLWCKKENFFVYGDIVVSILHRRPATRKCLNCAIDHLWLESNYIDIK